MKVLLSMFAMFLFLFFLPPLLGFLFSYGLLFSPFVWVPIFFTGFLLFSFSFMLVELVSIMSEFSHFSTCDKKSVCWLMFDINLHPLPGIDEVSWDVMRGWSIPYILLLKVPGHAYFHQCCSHHFLVLFLVIFSLCFRVEFPSFNASWLLVVMFPSDISIALLLGLVSILFRLT